MKTLTIVIRGEIATGKSSLANKLEKLLTAEGHDVWRPLSDSAGNGEHFVEPRRIVIKTAVKGGAK